MVHKKAASRFNSTKTQYLDALGNNFEKVSTDFFITVISETTKTPHTKPKLGS